MSDKMEITVLAFGQLVDITGQSEMKVENVNSTESLNKKLTGMFPELTGINFRFAVNKLLVQENTFLKNNDIVALLPPFSGG